MNGVSRTIDWLSACWDRLASLSHARLKRDFFINLGAFAVFMALVGFVINPYEPVCFIAPSGWFLAPGAWYYFWFPFLWALLLLVHFFVYSSLTVDEEAMVRKSREIRARSTDFGHMESIMDRQWEGDDSVVSPFDPRRRSDAFGRPLEGKGQSKPKQKSDSEADSTTSDD